MKRKGRRTLSLSFCLKLVRSFIRGRESGYMVQRLHTGKTAAWNGPIQNITSKVQSGKTYACSGWVRLDNTASALIKMTIKKVDGSATTYTNVATGTGSNSSWVQLSGSYSLTVSGTLTELSIYFEGPNSGINMYVDDVSVQ
jgi:hypothetical protein